MIGKSAIIGFNRRVLNTGVDHGGRDRLVSQEFLNAGDVHACIEQASGAGVAQAVRVQVFDPHRSADLGNMFAQPLSRDRLAVLLEPHGIILSPLAVV